MCGGQSILTGVGMLRYLSDIMSVNLRIWADARSWLWVILLTCYAWTDTCCFGHLVPLFLLLKKQDVNDLSIAFIRSLFCYLESGRSLDSAAWDNTWDLQEEGLKGSGRFHVPTGNPHFAEKCLINSKSEQFLVYLCYSWMRDTKLARHCSVTLTMWNQL